MPAVLLILDCAPNNPPPELISGLAGAENNPPAFELGLPNKEALLKVTDGALAPASLPNKEVDCF